MLAVAVADCSVQWQHSRWTWQIVPRRILFPMSLSVVAYFSLLVSDRGICLTLTGASQAMLYATGLREEDMQKPQVGLALNCHI